MMADLGELDVLEDSRSLLEKEKIKKELIITDLDKLILMEETR